MTDTRFAASCTPPAGPFAAFGAAWQSRGATGDPDLPRPTAGLTKAPREHGFHRTLKAALPACPATGCRPAWRRAARACGQPATCDAAGVAACPSWRLPGAAIKQPLANWRPGWSRRATLFAGRRRQKRMPAAGKRDRTPDRRRCCSAGGLLQRGRVSISPNAERPAWRGGGAFAPCCPGFWATRPWSATLRFGARIRAGACTARPAPGGHAPPAHMSRNAHA